MLFAAFRIFLPNFCCCLLAFVLVFAELRIHKILLFTKQRKNEEAYNKRRQNGTRFRWNESDSRKYEKCAEHDRAKTKWNARCKYQYIWVKSILEYFGNGSINAEWIAAKKWEKKNEHFQIFKMGLHSKSINSTLNCIRFMTDNAMSKFSLRFWRIEWTKIGLETVCLLLSIFRFFG